MAEEKKEIVIYTDGACEPNTRGGGYNTILLFEKRWRMRTQHRYAATTFQVKLINE